MVMDLLFVIWTCIVLTIHYKFYVLMRMRMELGVEVRVWTGGEGRSLGLYAHGAGRGGEGPCRGGLRAWSCGDGHRWEGEGCIGAGECIGVGGCVGGGG